MELVHLIFRFIHLVGFAALLGGLVAMIPAEPRKINRAVIDGAWTQFLTGFVLIVLNMPDVNYLKVGVKIALLAVIVALVMMNRERNLSNSVYLVLITLTFVTTGVAVFW